ncbi:MAG: hypothetical protein GWN29_08790 [Gammaproteobacteria bacterium]|nr:hypothetical protein [Gammaproteobacteria bacterium]
MSEKSAAGQARATPPPHGAAQGPATAETVTLAGVVLCFFLSGFAALLYQTAWLRQFSSVFGTSELAVAAVLAAYMGGLAAGAAVAGRFAMLVRRPIMTYGILEGGIAISALAVPLMLYGVRALYVSALGDQPGPPDAASTGQSMFYLLVAFVVLALPTGFMGATLPLLLRHAVRTDADVGPKVALLYATNTGGAVLGTLAAAFILLPVLGLTRTIWVGVAVNLLVFGFAAALARRAPVLEIASADPEERERARGPIGFTAACLAPLLRISIPIRERLGDAFERQPAWVMPLMLVSGANAFFYEVLWTRMLAHVMGGSIYAFATMLAAFLTGITLGGGLAGKIAANRDRAATAFAGTQLAIAGLSISVYQWMGPLLPTTQTTQSLVLYAVAVLLPATVFIGATFPLAVRILARDETEASPVAARVYAWNTVGAIGGAVLAGFVLIPVLGFEGSIKTAALINVCLALWTAAFVMRTSLAFVGVCATALVALAVIYQPSRPQAVVSSSGFALEFHVAPQEVFYSVGRSATVMVLEEDGHYFVRTNGLPEAMITARGGIPAQTPEKWLTALPAVARPDAQSMLVVGLGGGVALEGIPAFIADVDVVELEAQVLEANRFLQDQRHSDPLADERINVVLNDARNALRLTTKTYDVIASQPSHPWTAGASHLFTREFIAEAKAHLNDGGVFVQWISSEFVDEDLLRTLAATVSSEFEHVRLYQPSPPTLMFVASMAPLDVELQLARTGLPLSSDVLHFSYLGMNGVEDLLAALIADESAIAEFAAGAPISTDDDNRMATRSRFRADGLTTDDVFNLFAENDPLLLHDSWVYRDLPEDIDYTYLTRRLLRLGRGARAAAFASSLTDASSRFVATGVLLQATGQFGQAERAFNSALQADSRNAQARFALIEGRLGTLSEDLAASVSSALPASAAAVVRGWQLRGSDNLRALAELETDLARAAVTDAWYPEAAWLRAVWRSNVTEDRERQALDALRLIDRALVLDSDPRLYALRALSAVAADDPHYIVESFRFATATMRVRLASAGTLQAGEREVMQRNLSSMADRLQSDVEGVAPQRVAAVLRGIEALIERLAESAEP